METAGEPEGQQQRATSRTSPCEWPMHLPVDGMGVRSKGGGRRENGSMFAVFFLFVFVLFFISCYCCLFRQVIYFLGEGAGFVRRGVVVGGGFRPLRALRTLRPTGCLEFG